MLSRILCKKIAKRINNNNAKTSINESLMKIIHEGRLDHRYIVVFGAGWTSELMIECLSRNHIKVDAVIDNSRGKHDNLIAGIRIRYPEEILGVYRSDATVITASRFADDMKKQLRGMGYRRREQFIALEGISLDTTEIRSRWNYSFLYRKAIKWYGYETYKELIEKYGNNTFFFCIPVPGIGDTYIVCSYLRSYINYKNIDRYVLLVPGNVSKNIADCFGFSFVEEMPLNDIRYLKDYIAYNDGNLNARVMHWDKSSSYGLINEKSLPSERLTYLDVYKKVVFEEVFTREFMQQSIDTKQLDELFHNCGLIPNKTVIISPYAQSLSGISESFWLKLVQRLSAAGYYVCTNLGGKDEKEIEGTIPFRLPFNQIIKVCEHAGIFIGIRSGLCDVLSQADCLKFVIYPESINIKNVKAFFTLRSNEFDTKVVEVDYRMNREDDLIDLIIAGII